MTIVGLLTKSLSSKTRACYVSVGSEFELGAWKGKKKQAQDGLSNRAIWKRGLSKWGVSGKGKGRRRN